MDAFTATKKRSAKTGVAKKTVLQCNDSVAMIKKYQWMHSFLVKF